jgi:parallel beta-helix repeat protein
MKVCRNFLLIVFSFSVVSATTWYVHPDSALNSIQAGLDSCAATDTVLVGPGTYYENLVWPDVQSIVLMSEYGPDTTTIDGDSSGNVIYIHVGVDSTTIINGFTIQNGYSEWAGGIVCDGVDIFPDTCFPMIINNTITENTYAGIACQFFSPHIIGNTIIGNASCGIFCYASWPVVIVDNQITNNTGMAIVFDLSEGPVIGNTITGNNRGISCINAGGTFIGNIIQGNHEDGIHLYDSYATIDHCTISNNDGDGIDCAAIYYISPEIHYNNITNNGGYGILHEWFVDVIIDAEYNWWGDASGPGGFGPGTGDEVSAYVDYEPWLTDSVGVEEGEVVHVSIDLQISPNPFSKQTKISFGMGQGAEGMELKIYDISGRVIKQFHHFVSPIIWDGTDNNGKILPSGVYLLLFSVDGSNVTEKLLLMR